MVCTAATGILGLPTGIQDCLLLLAKMCFLSAEGLIRQFIFGIQGITANL